MTLVDSSAEEASARFWETTFGLLACFFLNKLTNVQVQYVFCHVAHFSIRK
jgi:hypothetical protein